MDRTRAWLAVAPVVAAGVLVAHALAYRLTGASAGPVHAYLSHAPQVLGVLVVVGVALAGVGRRLRGPSPWVFPFAALAGFAIQEHLERIAHTGELPVVVTSPAFLVGLALQVPFALVAWALARWLLDSLREEVGRGPALPRGRLRLPAPPGTDVARVPVGPLPARGPPLVPRP